MQKSDVASYERLAELTDIQSLKGLTDDDWADPKVVARVKSIVQVAAGGAVGVPVDDDAPPKHLADLKGKDERYINRHWQKITALLEAAGKAAEAERRAKLQKAAA